MVPNLSINDKMQHIIAFACWTLLVSIKPKRLFTYLCILILLIGGGVELAQSLFHRQAEWSDMIANCIGVLIVYIPVFLLKLIFERTRY